MKRLTNLGLGIRRFEIRPRTKRPSAPAVLVRGKIQRFGLLLIVLAGFVTLCLGQHSRSRHTSGGSRAPRLRVIQLAEPNLIGSVSFEQALVKQQSVRQFTPLEASRRVGLVDSRPKLLTEFTSQPLKFAQIGQLAWAGQGRQPEKALRTHALAGATYPIKLYFATPDAMFVYNPQQHSLEEIFTDDVRSRLAVAASKQEVVAAAACDIVIVGSVRKVAARYRNQARKYMLLEAGRIAQNIQLQSVCLHLGSVPIGSFDASQVRSICRLPAELEPICIICVGYPAVEPARQKPGQESQTRRTDTARVKRAVFIIASENFRDEELFETKRVLDHAGLQTLVASSKPGLIRGMLGTTAQATILLNQVRVDDYDAIIFVGGSGAIEYFDNPAALNIARQAAQKGKVLAAICIAPTILANAGVLKGLRATSFLSEQLKLQNVGAEYTGALVERDGLIITASGPRAAVQFGRAIAAALSGR